MFEPHGFGMSKALIMTAGNEGRRAPFRRRVLWLVGALLLAGVWSAEAVQGLKLESLTPGELRIEWTAPRTNPTDYRVRWAPNGQPFLTWSDSNGNAFPTRASHTITGLTAGLAYKVHVRARYDANHPQGIRSDPWSGLAVQRIDDYHGDGDTTGALTLDGSEDAWIASGGDVDWFAADLEAAEAYYVTVAGDEGLGGTAHRHVRRSGNGAAPGSSVVGLDRPGVHAGGKRHVLRLSGRHGRRDGQLHDIAGRGARWHDHRGEPGERHAG